MSAAMVVLRTDYVTGYFQIIGFELGEQAAAAIVADGRGELVEVPVPSAVYLLEDLVVRGITYPAGTLLQVEGQISAAEALALLRGRVARRRLVALAPAGGVG